MAWIRSILIDDLIDSREVGSPGQIGIPHEGHINEGCEECAAVNAEIDYGERGDDYNADFDNGGPYPRPTNWGRFSDEMY